MRIILSLILLLTACHSPVNYFDTGTFILADTSCTTNNYLQSFEDDAYPIYYLGPLKDTINIGHHYFRRQDARFKTYPSYCIFRYTPAQIAIQVDTLSPYASTIIIRNLSDTAVSLGITFSIYQMHREMLNSHGQWIKVNEKLMGNLYCATGQPNIYLLPGELIISKVFHFTGPHAIPCRLVLGHTDDKEQVYSNTFTEHINDSLHHIVD